MAEPATALPVAPPTRGVRRIEAVMGTVFGLDVRDAVPTAALDAAFAWLREVDARFSTYREDSDIRRLDRGELALEACGEDVRYVLARCEDLRRETDGAFDARSAGRDGRLDPSGYVKGWAADRAGAILDAAGARTYAINAGGDVLVRGGATLRAEAGHGWRVGIRHPLDRTAVAAALELDDGAVATSGAYERGTHIRDGRSGRAPVGLRSMTVVGPSLELADAYATAAFAMGRPGVEWIAARSGFGAIAITDDDRVVWTPVAERLRAR